MLFINTNSSPIGKYIAKFSAPEIVWKKKKVHFCVWQIKLLNKF